MTLKNFILAMLLFPDAQRTAQEELDRVVGRSRLPSMEDKESLPYVTALKNEVLRYVANLLRNEIERTLAHFTHTYVGGIPLCH